MVEGGVQNINRRQFAQFGGATVALAVAGQGGRGLARMAAPGTAPPAAVDVLAPIATELRPAAQHMLALKIPPITARTLRDRPPGAGAPRFELLPHVPVTPRRIPAQGALPEVGIFIINADPARHRPAILHIHGGGFILGTAEGELRPLQDMALELDCVIVTVDYRLSPETRYTGSTLDNYAGLHWLHANATKLGVDPNRIALLGESAGGGHAALLAIMARDRGEIPLVLQALVYPMLDDRTGSSVPVPSHIATIGWSVEENRLGWQSFLGVEPGSHNVPTAAVPSRLTDFRGLAPAWIGVGGVDLFAAEDMDYARRLTLANVPTELLVIPGAFHGFDRAAADTLPAKRFTKAKLKALRRAFGRPVEV